MERAQETWDTAMSTERMLKELRKENDCNRQMLAKVESTFKLFPTGPFAPAAPLAAHRGPGVPEDSQIIRLPRKEGHTVGAQESRVTCSGVLNVHNHGRTSPLFSL